MKTKIQNGKISQEVIIAQFIRERGLSLHSFYSKRKRAKAKGVKWFKWEKWIVEL